MIRKPFLILVLGAALPGLLAAGCGSSSSPSNSPATSSSSGSTSSGSTSTPTTTSSSSPSNPAVAQAVTACKASINSATGLSSSEKAKLSGVCDKAAHGDATGAKKIVAEVCRDIVNADVPAAAGSAAKQQALAACKAA